MFTPEFLAIITTAVGMTTLATEAIKTRFPVKGIGAWILSAIVAIIVSIVHGMTAGLDPVGIVFLSIATALSANGLYRFVGKK